MVTQNNGTDQEISPNKTQAQVELQELLNKVGKLWNEKKKIEEESMARKKLQEEERRLNEARHELQVLQRKLDQFTKSSSENEQVPRADCQQSRQLFRTFDAASPLS